MFVVPTNGAMLGTLRHALGKAKPGTHSSLKLMGAIFGRADLWDLGWPQLRNGSCGLGRTERLVDHHECQRLFECHGCAFCDE